MKPSQAGTANSIRATPGGRFNAQNLTLKQLLMFAYNVQEYQITGGPKWVYSTGYDVAATPDRPFTPSPETIDKERAMLLAVLNDRFHLAIQRSTKELPVYALVIAKDGPKMKEREAPSDPRQIRLSGGQGLMNAQAITMDLVAQNLSRRLGRRVDDATGLTAHYDFELHWTPDESEGGAPASGDRTGPSIFTALQEKLGLRLEGRRGAVEILTVTKAEPPSEN